MDFVNGDPYGFIFLSKANNRFVNAYKSFTTIQRSIMYGMGL